MARRILPNKDYGRRAYVSPQRGHKEIMKKDTDRHMLNQGILDVYAYKKLNSSGIADDYLEMMHYYFNKGKAEYLQYMGESPELKKSVKLIEPTEAEIVFSGLPNGDHESAFAVPWGNLFGEWAAYLTTPLNYNFPFNIDWACGPLGGTVPDIQIYYEYTNPPIQVRGQRSLELSTSFLFGEASIDSPYYLISPYFAAPQGSYLLDFWYRTDPTSWSDPVGPQSYIQVKFIHGNLGLQGYSSWNKIFDLADVHILLSQTNWQWVHVPNVLIQQDVGGLYGRLFFRFYFFAPEPGGEAVIMQLDDLDLIKI